MTILTALTIATLFILALISLALIARGVQAQDQPVSLTAEERKSVYSLPVTSHVYDWRAMRPVETPHQARGRRGRL